ncbi:MAG: N-acetyltransferase [Pseudomonadota bacterium]
MVLEAAPAFDRPAAASMEDKLLSFIESNGSETLDFDINDQTLTICLVDTEDGRHRASSLIHKMYSSRGYDGTHHLQEGANRITLTASIAESVVGTITLGIDSPAGILADEIFKHEVDEHRARGGNVCELTKLAFDPTVRSKLVLASLFHVAFIYLQRIHRCTDIFIEVNPRHRLFYERMLGFKRQGARKMNPRVNAPAFLLWADVAYIDEQIRLYGGTSDGANIAKSLYPYFFPPLTEEQNQSAIDRYRGEVHDHPITVSVLDELSWPFQGRMHSDLSGHVEQSH